MDRVRDRKRNFHRGTSEPQSNLDLDAKCQKRTFAMQQKDLALIVVHATMRATKDLSIRSSAPAIDPTEAAGARQSDAKPQGKRPPMPKVRFHRIARTSTEFGI